MPPKGGKKGAKQAEKAKATARQKVCPILIAIEMPYIRREIKNQFILHLLTVQIVEDKTFGLKVSNRCLASARQSSTFVGYLTNLHSILFAEQKKEQQGAKVSESHPSMLYCGATNDSICRL